MSVQGRDQIVLVLVLDWPDYDDEDDDDVPPEPAGKDTCPTLNSCPGEGFSKYPFKTQKVNLLVRLLSAKSWVKLSLR